MDARTKALKAHRTRLKKRGMKRVEVSVPSAEAAVIRKAASVLRERTGEAARLRQILGFPAATAGAESAAALFAMAEPLSPNGEALWEEAMTRIERDRRDSALNRPRDAPL